MHDATCAPAPSRGPFSLCAPKGPKSDSLVRRFTYVSVFGLAFEYVRATYSSMPSLAQLEERQTVMVAVASECRPFEPGRKDQC